MRIVSINNAYNTGLKSQYMNYPAFNGKIEADFFNSLKNGNKQKALELLSDIKFDITVQEKETGNNALHYILENGSPELWKKCKAFLETIVSKINPNAVKTALDAKNHKRLQPMDLITNKDFKAAVYEYFSGLLPDALSPKIVIEPPKIKKSKKSASVKNTEKPREKIPEEKVGNEVTSIDTSALVLDFDAFDAEPVINKFQEKQQENFDSSAPFGNVIGSKKAVQALNDYVINPIKNNNPTLINGLLLYGNGDNGKTFLVEEMANVLGKKITTARKVLSQLEKVQGKSGSKEIEKILNDCIISVTLNDVQIFDSVLDYISDNYKINNKKTIVFIDEIAKFFTKDTYTQNIYSSGFVPDFMQKFDNFSAHGGLLIGTTNDIDFIQGDLLRSNRFQKLIELKLPTFEERREIFERLCPDKLSLEKSDYEKILKKTAGFTFGDLTSMLRMLNGTNSKLDYNTLNDTIEKFAQEHEFGELSEEGTTSNYDTKFLKRTPVNINFSEVAGLEQIKEAFRNNIIDRLKPEVKERFRKNNLPLISTNFLLYGPPGTGKTFIVKALSGETKIPLYIIDASSFKSKWYGETERNLKKIFNQLENKYKQTGEYSILFFDEANKILGKRDSEFGSSSDSENVEQLLQYIDKSYERGIITIMATNFKDKMDAAVLSRLGEQLRLDAPDIDTIFSLITILLKNVSIGQDITGEEIKDIASKVRGFGSREITQMITGIINNRLAYSEKPLTVDDIKTGISQYAQEHGFPEINNRNQTSAYDKFIKRLEISPDDPQTLDDVGGMKAVKEKLLSAVMATSSNREKSERYARNRVKPENGILLYGPPGCGKTYIMKALAAHLNIPLYEFKLSNIGSEWAHKTTGNIGKIFEQLKEKYKATGEKSILMLDEFEDIAGNRAGQLSQHNIEETNAVLKEVSDASKNGIIIVAATNHYEKIDPAMKRPGRFTSIEITPPDYESRFDIIHKSLKGREIADSILKNSENIKTLAEISEGFSVADITETINQLVRKAIDSDLEQLPFEHIYNAFVEKAENKRVNITAAIEIEG